MTVNSPFLISDGGRLKTSLVRKKGRSRWELIRDILMATLEEEKVKKTRIMQKAYLDWRNFNRYFDFLSKDGFITKCDPDEFYTLTEKGRDLLKRLKNVEEILS